MLLKFSRNFAKSRWIASTIFWKFPEKNYLNVHQKVYQFIILGDEPEAHSFSGRCSWSSSHATWPWLKPTFLPCLLNESRNMVSKCIWSSANPRAIANVKFRPERTCRNAAAFWHCVRFIAAKDAFIAAKASAGFTPASCRIFWCFSSLMSPLFSA